MPRTPTYDEPTLDPVGADTLARWFSDTRNYPRGDDAECAAVLSSHASGVAQP